MSNCAFRDDAHGVRCERARTKEEFCYFHHTHNSQFAGAAADAFDKELKRLIDSGDGNWCGFVFPQTAAIRGYSFDFDIDLRGASFRAMRLVACNFHRAALFSRAQFAGDVLIDSCNWLGSVSFEEVVFSGALRWSASSQGDVSFASAHIRGWAKFYGEFDGPARFGGATFYDGAEFLGGMIHHQVMGGAPFKPSRPRYLFNDEAHFGGVDFRRPNRVRFRMVDLRKAHVCEADFRGVEFSDINWAQPSLGRRGVYDEVWALEKGTLERRLPVLEAGYRNLRVAHEESKDFQSATDFYIGEMEARRRQLPRRRRWLGVEGVYRILSNYGTSPLRAFVVLLSMLALHALVTTAVLYPACLAFNAGCRVDPELARRTVALLSIIRSAGFAPLPGWGFAVDVLGQVLVVVQLALLAFALRARIRRA